ncbi:signal recognition particle receptor subunit beta [Paramormyrops kingsleyae]|uniref:Signal recognition particle receptor subunit beta n=1 Tax=Paramormyrops kingsleyae TaxID=1676925 RepID=A0A3B3ST02_9TELE|nr:signal recognition particle receptor subunit beta [Paramormyrops kingsleyae]
MEEKTAVQSEFSYLDSFLKELHAQNPAVLLGLVVAVIVVLFTIVFFQVFWSRKSTRNAILLIGLCDAGKTLLFSRLLSGKFKRTQTSITDSSAIYKAKNDRARSWTLIDLPGHESLRPQFIEKFKSMARAIVFVVDSAIFQKEVRDVAELLYSLLTDSVVVKNAPTLLVACNKQDITMAKSSKLIRQQLEKELNTLRVTRSAALSSQDGSSGGTSVPLGKKAKDFEFSQLPMHVEFVECSALGGGAEEAESDMEALEMCLARVA